MMMYYLLYIVNCMCMLCLKYVTYLPKIFKKMTTMLSTPNTHRMLSKVNMSILKIGTFNCQGINDYYTRRSLFDFFENSNLSIIFLQETKLKPENINEYTREWHNKNCIFNSIPGGKN